MPVRTRTERLLNPTADAPYSVETVCIPATGVGVPQALIDQFKLPTEQAQRLHQRASEARQPATLLTPRSWRGDTILLIPGAGDNRHAFKWLLFGKLLEQNLAVLTVDPPGHGEFNTVPCTVNNAQTAAHNWSDWLHAQTGVKRVAAVGISFGGCQAAYLTHTDERIRALATISTPVVLPSVTRWVIARESLTLMMPRNLSLLRYQSARAMWREWRGMAGAWFGEGLYDMIARFDMLGTVRAIGARPTMFVHGTRDVAVPPANTQHMFDAALPERDILWVPSASHLSAVLHDREMTRLAGWLATRLSSMT